MNSSNLLVLILVLISKSYKKNKKKTLIIRQIIVQGHPSSTTSGVLSNVNDIYCDIRYVCDLFFYCCLVSCIRLVRISICTSHPKLGVASPWSVINTIGVYVALALSLLYIVLDVSSVSKYRLLCNYFQPLKFIFARLFEEQ